MSSVLSPPEVDFFKYFISKYKEHSEKGQLQEANHCAIAVLLELETILDSKEEINGR